MHFCARLWIVAELLLISASPSFSQQSKWVQFGANGKLDYAHSPRGDRIPDFSWAGYRGGGVALPSVPARSAISPSGSADDTAAIQAALDAVAKLEPGVNGQHGAVELAAGTFHLAGTLHISASGVVLRGAGASGPNATVLELMGAPHLAIEVKGELHESKIGGATAITDAYVPAGTLVIHVADASGIHAGDTLQIVKPVTPAWVHFMQMDNLSRDGQHQVWVNSDIRVRRRVRSVAGNTVTLEVPLTDSFDSQFYPGVQPAVTPLEVSGQIAETGVENLQVSAPKRAVAVNEDAEFDGIQMDDVVDSWLRSLAFWDVTTAVRIGAGAERMTIASVDVKQHVTVTSHAKPFHFSVNGSQILLDRVSGRGDKVMYFSTQSRSQGPVVVLHCHFLGDGNIEPHQRWSTGLLVDGCEVPSGGIHLMNRGEMGTGHGWTIGWSVLWNNKASAIVVQNPPGAANWSIGDEGAQAGEALPQPGKGSKNWGAPLPGGIVESKGKHVEPASLYLQQLRERLGPAAVAAIGY
jgi:hypothetical protein